MPPLGTGEYPSRPKSLEEKAQIDKLRSLKRSAVSRAIPLLEAIPFRKVSSMATVPLAPATYRYRFYPGNTPMASYNIQDEPDNVRNRAWLESTKAIDPVGEVDGPTFYLISIYKAILYTDRAELINGKWQPVAGSRTDQVRFDIALRSQTDFSFNLIPLNPGYEYLNLEEQAGFTSDLLDSLDTIKQASSPQSSAGIARA